MKKIQVILMLFCLGIFILPKQLITFQKSEMTCNISSSKNDCCKDTQHNNHNNSEKKENCGDDCYSCGTCHTFAVFSYPFLKDNDQDLRKIPVTKEKFTYVTPDFSDVYSKIWQPPKIG